MKTAKAQRFLNVLTVMVVVVSVVVVAKADFICLMVPPGPGGGPAGCDMIIVNGSPCCPCDEFGNPTGNCETPPDPPTADPPTIPDPRPPVCEENRPGDQCPGRGGAVAGRSCHCNDTDVMKTMMILPVTDLSVATGGDDCDQCGGDDTGSNGCSGCGTTSSPGILVAPPSVRVTRRLIPANQTSLFSFGRGMAAEFDVRLTLYPSGSGDPVALLFDPRVEQVFYLEDTGSTGNYLLANNVYYKSILLTDANGNPVTDPSIAATQTVYATITRRNGWVYNLEVCPTPLGGGEYCSRLLSEVSPQGHSISYTHKTFTQAEIDSSPERQLQIDTITDIYGNTASLSYHSQQQGGLWVVSQVDFNSGNKVVDYQYDTNGLLTSVSRGSEVTSTYSYSTDVNYNMATLTWSERERYSHDRNDSLLLSLDYQNGNGTVVNQYTNILQGGRNGAGHVKFMLYRDLNNPGWFKVLNEGRMSKLKLGESIQHYEAFTNNGSGYNGITGTLETAYAHSVVALPIEVDTSQPRTCVDETGYSVDLVYDSQGNPTREDHSDGTWRQWAWDSNNQESYYRDRAGFVTITERDANHNIVRVIRGMTDVSGSGTPTATAEAVQDIYGYYPTGHANQGMLQWSATTAYTGTSFSPPPADERFDFTYNTNQQLIKVQSPKPNGQSTRPEVVTQWIGSQKTSVTDELGHTKTFTYDVLDRLTRILFSDGTTFETLYDDVSNTIFKKNRLGVVEATTYGLSGRVTAVYLAYGRDTDLSDGQIDSLNSVDDYHSIVYAYPAGESQPTHVYRDGALTTTAYDHRGRVVSVTKSPRAGTTLTIENVYVGNQLFYRAQKTGSHEIRTYNGYSANRQTVRTIQTRKPGVTFADNSAVLNATRVTGANPDFTIDDAIRDIRGQVVQLVDPLNIETLIVHDSLGRSLSQTQSQGSLSLTNQASYDADGNVTQTISENGLVIDLTYDPAGNLKTKTVAPGTSVAATWTYTYTKDSRLETETAPNSAVKTYVYQTCCGLTQGIKDPLGHGTVTNSNSEGRPVHSAVLEDFDSHTNLLDPLDSKTLSESTTRYRDDGNIQYRTTWNVALGPIDRDAPPIAGVGGVPVSDGVTTQYLYDSNVFDEVGLDSTAGLTVNRLGSGTAQISIKPAVDKLAEAIANGGAGTSFQTDITGFAVAIVSPDEKSVVVTISDASRRKVMKALMTGPATSSPNQLVNWNCTLHDEIDASTAGVPTTKTISIDPDGNTIQTLTDGLGHQIVSIDQLGNQSTRTYNSNGSVLTATDALAHTTTFTYDDLGRQLTETNAMGNTLTTNYNATTGLIDSRSDAKGSLYSSSYDAAGRETASIDRLGKTTAKTYDTMGQLTSVTDAENQTTTYAYDLAGQRTSITLPDNSTKLMNYDAAGRLTKTTLASGKSQTSIYEFSGNLDKVEYRDASNTVSGTDELSYDAQNRRISSTSRYGVVRDLTYTQHGSLDTDTTTYGGQSYVVDYDYDARGRMTEIGYPSGRIASYTFDARSFVDTISWAGTQIEDRIYNAIGSLTQVDRSFIDEIRTYNAVNRVATISNTNVGDATYTYDANGNRLSETWTGTMSAWSFTNQKPGSTYPDGYDAEDRFRNFVQASQNVDLYLNRSDIGNIASIDLNGTNTSRTYSNSHELTSIGGTSQTFGVDGNLGHSHTGIDFAFDEANRLSQAVVGVGDTAGIEGINEYGYDSSQNRVWKKITRNGSVAEHTVFIYAGPNCIAEYTSGAAATSPDQEYVYAKDMDRLVMLVRNNGAQKLVVTTNRQQNVTSLSDHSNGTILERYTYDAFGNRTILAADGSTVRTTSSYDNPYGFTSRRHDVETGLMYFRARMFDPLTGEFLSKDPQEYVGQMSLYRGSFVSGKTDPTGQIEYDPDWLGSSGCYDYCIGAGGDPDACNAFCSLPIPGDWPQRPPEIYPPILPPGIDETGIPPRCGIITVPPRWPHDIDWGEIVCDLPENVPGDRDCSCSTSGRSTVRPPGGPPIKGRPGGGVFIDADLDCFFGQTVIKKYAGDCKGEKCCDSASCSRTIRWKCTLRSKAKPGKGTKWVIDASADSECKKKDEADDD